VPFQQLMSINGRCLRKVEVAGFTVMDAVYAPGMQLRRHTHEQATLSFVLKGGFSETLASGSEDCGPQSFISRPPGVAHANHYGPDGARNLIIEIANSRLDLIQTYVHIHMRPMIGRGGPQTWLAVRLHRELEARDRASILTIEGLALELLAETWCPRPAGAPASVACLKRAEEYLHSNFDQPIGLADVASAAGVHPAYLARVFRLWRHCTVGEYLRRIRLTWATEQLGTSDTPIADISLKAGFYDQSHFTNSFRRLTGLTPSVFRQERGARLPKM
jgi:AraC family transcriptional regulator